MNIGEKIKKSREKENLSIRKLARLTGVSATHLSRIEQNIQCPTPKVLKQITRYIDLNYNNLMKELGLGLNIGLDNPYICEYYSNLKGDDLRLTLKRIEQIVVEHNRICIYLNKLKDKNNDTSNLLLDTIEYMEYLIGIEEEILHLLERNALREYRNMSEG